MKLPGLPRFQGQAYLPHSSAQGCWRCACLTRNCQMIPSWKDWSSVTQRSKACWSAKMVGSIFTKSLKLSTSCTRFIQHTFHKLLWMHILGGGETQHRTFLKPKELSWSNKPSELTIETLLFRQTVSRDISHFMFAALRGSYMHLHPAHRKTLFWGILYTILIDL